ncbi:RluA family pseudouridine synthase [Desulfoluna sp.]|uniref:RluA family pseudouridine synthase n=1 Tax=Desulfoluna sp. TaxID=2045199 RepID=UPI002601DBF4|nr:RluA family pseudouridine synthase [Desulfoluna sp.]
MVVSQMKKWQHCETISGMPVEAGACLAASTGLSRGRVKLAMKQGSVWIRQGKKRRRIRHAKRTVQPGETLEIYYDEALLTSAPPEAWCLKDGEDYSVWFKPAGLLTQGTLYGDHFSLERKAELHFAGTRHIHPVHRLDRETAGLVILAHGKKSAAALSALFRESRIEKIYRAELLGDLPPSGTASFIDLPIDGKEAKTEFVLESVDAENHISTVLVRLHTGRMHQIRRHFDMMGHPVMGDPRYGEGNKNRFGLRLAAVRLSFVCPFLKRQVVFTTDETLPDPIFRQPHGGMFG